MVGLLSLVGLVSTFSSWEGAVFAYYSSCLFLLMNSEGECFSSLFFWDSLTTSMVCLLFVLSGMVLSISKSKLEVKALNICSMACMLFFVSSDFLMLFIFFEVSIIPLLFILGKGGSSSERMSAGLYLTLFTFTSSIPLFIFCLKCSQSGVNLIFTGAESSGFLSLSLLGFLVKLPLFSLHSWLPRAHVESPLVGSVLLAGVMLKLGFYGLFRLFSVFCFEASVLKILLMISLLGSTYSFCLALSSDDMKKSVAYSSVAHMNFSLGALISHSESSFLSSWVSIFSHGLISPLLFWIVTEIYTLSGSRSVLISKGVGASFPHLKTSLFVIWVLNISPPLTIPFLGEVGMSLSVVLFLGGLGALAVLMCIMMGSFFSILNYTILSHESSKLKFKSNFFSLGLHFFTAAYSVILILLFPFSWGVFSF
nr:NADH dehydrogenase subunit 4 [Saemundssonia lari]